MRAAVVAFGLVVGWVAPETGRAQVQPQPTPQADAPFAIPDGGQRPLPRVGANLPDGLGTDPAVSAPPPPPTPPEAMQRVTAAALVAMDLAGMDGNELGDVDRVIEGVANSRRFVVVSRGTIFGLFGAKEVALPIENVAIRGDTLILRSVTDTQLSALPDFTQQDTYRTLPGDASLEVATQR